MPVIRWWTTIILEADGRRPSVVDMPSPAQSTPGSWRAPAAAALLTAWLVGALVATASGTVLLAPFDPCGQGSGCAGVTILVTEYAVRYGPLLLLLAVLPPAAARMMQRRDPLPIIAVGVGALAVLLAAAMLIAAIAG